MERSCLSVLPGDMRSAVEAALMEGDEEIRIRAELPVMLCGRAVRRLEYIPAAAECEALLELICGHSLYAHSEELKGCYVTLEDGSRVGMAGQMTRAGMTMPHSFNIRIAHQAIGAADGLVRHIVSGDRVCSALLASVPGAGKTTVLRDAARQLSLMGYRVGIADERGEIAAQVAGIPKLDVGCADVMGGCAKGRGMELLLRGMSPQILIADEIASNEDAEAVLEASGCGVKVIASAHGSGRDMLRREGIKKALEQGAFDKVLLLKSTGGIRSIEDISGEVI